MKQKLLKRSTLQYLKQGNVIYFGGQGWNIPVPTDRSYLAHRSKLRKYYYGVWHKNNPNKDVALDENFFSRGHDVIGSDAEEFNQDFQKWVNQHYYENPDWNRSIWRSENHYIPLRRDNEGTYISLSGPDSHMSSLGWTSVGEHNGQLIYENGSNQTLQEYLNEKNGPGHVVKNIQGEWRVYLPKSQYGNAGQPTYNVRGTAQRHDYGRGEVEYAVDPKTAKPIARYKSGRDTNWYYVAEGSTGYDKNGNYNVLKGVRWLPADSTNAAVEASQAGATRFNPTVETSTEKDVSVPAKTHDTSEESTIATEKREIVASKPRESESVKTEVPQRKLVKKTPRVARPENMPLMNRDDIRYTMNDISNNSFGAYGSSDVSLVNNLSETDDNNMFKRALMNRLGMSKWDNDTALNRLNRLGIRGHIGGSDRRRIRDLINKGTTIDGQIRHKKGGVLKLIKKHG